MNNMHDVINNLSSDKVKERQEGLTTIREVFASDRVVNTFAVLRDGKVKPKLWLTVFQAIFSVVLKEKNAITRKSTAKSVSTTAAIRRLSEAASTLRWLIERAVRVLNANVAEACIEHLTQMMLSSREIFDAVALDYSKALRCVVAFQPHLDHLKSDTWLKIASLSFNVILGDPLRKELVEEDGMESEDVPSDMYVEDSEEDEVDELPSTSKAKKRSRRHAAPLPILPPQKSQPKSRQKRNVVVSVSLEQVEFTSILRILLSAPSAPLLAAATLGSQLEDNPAQEKLPLVILNRLERFLERYPADSSLLRDYVAILSAILDHISLNKVFEVAKFARSTWDALISLWGTKDRVMKEGLLGVLRHLFPFVTCSLVSEHKLPSFDCGESIGQLWQLLESEAESRWGVDGLSLDALRLEIELGECNSREGVFLADTFRAGWNFDSVQALSWAVLELQADCAAKLFQLSETMQSGRPDTKRVRLENPIISLLQSIQSKTTRLVRSYHLQVLLFVIDRHWSLLHDSLKQDVMNTLQLFITNDDPSIQSWVFVNFAAIAIAERPRTAQGQKDRPSAFQSGTWDTLWAHAVRRVNVPGICRAACHAGFALLSSSQSPTPVTRGFITGHRILLEIETLLKDMDVQGPSFPFDSVCFFLSQCLILASQDVRLYRMHLEDKVLSWLIDNWKVVGNRTKMLPYTISDIAQLLDTLSGLSKRSVLANYILLPQADIVDRLIEERKTQVIQDFVLDAKLPVFAGLQLRQQPEHVAAATSNDATTPLIPPRSRDRKISGFFSRTLESLIVEWELLKDHNPTAEMARRSLDFALSAIVFETSLTFNGITANVQVIQNAGKVISFITPLLLGQRWILNEKLLVTQAFESMMLNVQPIQDDYFREALSCAGANSGIQERILQKLVLQDVTKHQAQDEQSIFLRQMWQHPDVQEVFNPITTILKILLSQIMSGSKITSENAMDIDEKDGFGPIRTTAPQSNSDTTTTENGSILRRLFKISIGFASCAPFLQSAGEKETRDSELTELILKSSAEPQNFCMACPVFFQFTRQKIFHLSLRNQQLFVEKFGDLLQQYSLSKNQQFIHVVLDFLLSTLGSWKSQEDLAGELHRHLQHLYAWLSRLMKGGNCGSWALRDAIARFLGQYLEEDSAQGFWAVEDHFDNLQDHLDSLPSALLPRLSNDQDIRVRFRASFINAGLFSITQHLKQSPDDLYEHLKHYYPPYLENYEYMLTRLLALGNVLVVSSAVRRGAYWHVLETCIHPSTHTYASHIESILIGVSERLGMPSLSSLFEAYASQLAYSLQKIGADFLRFPPHLLGYLDRRSCAEATFQSLGPFNLLFSGDKLFETHCKIIQKDPTTGFRQCFGNVIGFLILETFEKAFIEGSNVPDNLEQQLQEKCSFIPNFTPPFHDTVDAMVTTVLKSIVDQDFSDDGPNSILISLRSFDSRLVSPFQALTRYRIFDGLRAHRPNLPAFPTQIVLQGVLWISSRWGGFTRETTYHVMHELFNELNNTPLVNEQHRLINSLSVWIAYRHQDFNEPTVSDALIHGATFLLAQYDLALAAKSILEWAFGRYPASANWKESRLPNMLVRIRCVAQDYCAEDQNRATFLLGQDLVKWMDGQMVVFARKGSSFGNLVRKILPTWPQQPSFALAKLYEETTMFELSSILEGHRITSNKFRLVRRLHELVPSEGKEDDQFSKMFFWRLKECIPDLERLQEDDVHAFTSLLSFYNGQIGSLNVEQANMLAPRNRHRKNVKKRLADDTIPARDAITLGLLVMLDDDNPRRVSRAYETLRLAISVVSQDDPLLVIPHEYRMDLEFFKVYKRPSCLPTALDIEETLQSEAYLKSSTDFDVWLPQLSSLLADALATTDPFFGQLSPIVSTDVDFSEHILPILVHTILQVDRQTEPSKLPMRRILSQYFTTILTVSPCDIRCTRSIVDVILHLRHFSGKRDALFYNKWLDVDFSLLARSAILYGAYTTALLFVELAGEHYPSTIEPKATEQVLYEIYAHIDEPDGFYGINTQDLQQFLVKRFHHEKQWDKAFKFHGAALEADSSRGDEQIGLLQSFHSFGFDSLAIESLRFFRERSSGLTTSSMNYKLGWRTETWDLPEQATEQTGAALYRSLRAIYRERDPVILQSTVRNALYEEMAHLQTLGSENLAEIRLVSQDLMCLREITQWRQQYVPFLHRQDEGNGFDWSSIFSIDSGFEFTDLESIMAIRISLVRSIRQREERQQIGSMVTPLVRNLLEVEKKCLLRLSQAARASDQVQVALNSVIRAQKLHTSPSPEVIEELANVLWLQKEEKTAVQFLQGVVRSLVIDESHDSIHNALLLSRLGTWTSEACLEKPADIWERYFSRSIELLNASPSAEDNLALTKATVYRECAMFAERQHQSVLKSPDALRWKIYVDRKTNEIEYRDQEITRTQSDALRYKLRQEQSKAQKLLQEDSELFRKHNHLRESLLKQAIEMHSLCLETSSAFDDDSAIRLCSLWFANFEDESLLDAVSDALDRIPSRKLIFLAHQITARLSQPPTSELPRNQEILQRIVLRMCREHPFHSLYQVYSISDHLTSSDNRRHSGRLAQSTQTERGTAADALLNRLRCDDAIGSRVKSVEYLCNACLEWAKFPILKKPEFKKSRSNPKLNIPTHLKILSITSSNLKVPVPTATIPLDPTLKYEKCAWIERYDPNFDTAGGVNLPKVTVCIGSDGQHYKQLFKGEGNDDLRQDAVMEQVFDLVNNLLKRDRETKRRDLGVRGYKIIPLSNQAGLLEFVGNTQPMRDWLVRAHLNYHPKDLRSDEVTVRLKDAQEKYKDRHEKQLEAFLEARKRFRPVMRHYFTEKHKAPIPWFQMRLKYTRSVATTSIVGHVIGLGDRHLSNILMDNVSGEVVHIDLGIAFDQGKLLGVPERVPFRMTADVVDGMGTSGTAGVFQRCAEETLRVLRDESGVIMTVLEVFKHDPLHSWTASEIKVKQVQSDVPTTPSISINDNSRFNLGIGLDMTSGSADEAADRALSSVARKLDKSLSIESTVNELIAEATDPMNLATLFYGWAPHM
ncbi:hypothetical protein CPB83DRAFT_905353 [Crepidotus variabilis]|uniref:Serine/threonine-protein kinase Tel1 n=1 Tax=Crepidotus variabilis TaxID=179855 RepID=A0A9P6JSC6_9AGAR|nr:hypothetical protein CPB83DRAFT_905353 [Crepidotus variabilis]